MAWCSPLFSSTRCATSSILLGKKTGIFVINWIFLILGCAIPIIPMQPSTCPQQWPRQCVRSRTWSPALAYSWKYKMAAILQLYLCDLMSLMSLFPSNGHLRLAWIIQDGGCMHAALYFLPGNYWPCVNSVEEFNYRAKQWLTFDR
eukprot:TRINITY_DN16015_c0_g1_i1.p1 TRINITY_DN16015_c0_g1~~TRINITY_DN16015_c0_g1_i1.p1  ORF type:complete len:146 (+),score=8.73 TRINITY_DN16015_c0_g1_i1:284-721(+)